MATLKPGETFFVVDQIGNQVLRFDAEAPTGRLVAGGRAASDFKSPSGAAICADGRCLVADTGGSRVVAVGEAERPFAFAGRRGYGDGADELKNPTDVAVGPLAGDENAVYIADKENHRIVAVSGGQMFLIAGGHGPGGRLYQLAGPSAVAVDRDGSVFVADTLNNRVLRFAPGETMADLIFDDEYALSRPSGIALAPNGEVLVADTGNQRVLAFPRAGRARAFPGVFGRPTALAAAVDGTFYIVDTELRCVFRYAPGASMRETVTSGDRLARPTGVAVAIFVAWAPERATHSRFPPESRALAWLVALVLARLQVDSNVLARVLELLLPRALVVS